MVLVEGWTVREASVWFRVSTQTVNRMLGLLKLTGHVPEKAEIEIDLGRFFERQDA